MRYIFFVLFLLCAGIAQAQVSYNANGIPVASTISIPTTNPPTVDDYSVEDCWDCPGREDEESSDDSHGDNKHYDDVYYNPGNQAVTPSTTTNNYYYYNNNNNSNTNVVPVAPYIVYPYYNQQYGYRYYSPYHYYYGNQGYYMGGSNPKATIVVNGAKFFLQASFAFNTRPTYDRWYQQNRQWCPLEWISLK